MLTNTNSTAPIDYYRGRMNNLKLLLVVAYRQSTYALGRRQQNKMPGRAAAPRTLNSLRFVFLVVLPKENWT